MDPNPNKALDKLDYEYLQILRLIKPYITCIMNNHYIELIKLWLEKLSGEDVKDKQIRNAYLIQLGHQIEEGIFKDPFTQPPPQGSLQNLTEINSNESIVDEKVSTEATLKPEKSFQKRKSKQNISDKSENNYDDSDEDENHYHLCCRTFDNFASNRADANVYINDNGMNDIISYASKENQLANEDSSWMDLSEEEGMGDASTIFKNDDTLYESKISNLLNIIDQLRKENSTLNEIVRKHEKEMQNCTKHQMGGIVGDVQVLKNRIHEFLDIKTALQNNQHSVTAEWQIIIANLQKKLSYVQRRNCELKNVINNLENKLIENQRMSAGTPQKCVLLVEMHKKEVEMMKQKYKQDLENAEISYVEQLDEKHYEYNEKVEDLKCWFQTRLCESQSENDKAVRDFYEKQVEAIKQDYEHKMKTFCDEKLAEIEEVKRLELEEKFKAHAGTNEELKAYYEVKMIDAKVAFEKEIKFKDSEISRLEMLLQEQCANMQEEVKTIRDQIQVAGAQGDGSSDEKVEFLQKCVLKMDKLYKKSERQYVKNIFRLKRDLEIRDKHNQIQLSTQRVKLISSNSIVRQKEIDEIVYKLEQQYKTILINQQNEAIKEKKNNLRVISELREELSKLKASKI